MSVSTKPRVLLTGPGGRIGPSVVPLFSERFDLRLLDKNPIPEAKNAIVSDLSDINTLTEALSGMDCLVHLAATSDEAPFVEQLVPNNVIGLYNIFEAARLSGVKRIVFASTVQAVGFYPNNHTVQATDLPRPVSLYGCTKAFGETLGRYYFDRHGIEFIGVRIGWFQNYDSPLLRNNRGARSIWLSPNDAAGILARCVEAENIGYALVFATSKTEFERLSLAPARELLNYTPIDDINDIAFEES
jgi:nucleoside-diphosphate-sugar epimerase